ncbi:unnamed protein product [Parnassius mnemosyne]|uniref:PiggyBac transposable element-derived protein domain-containing protein n=1 Tax=Parnassius mnemosyne TaxID=213953 RepID=A0AAV1M5Q9_9NEOP
MPSIESCFSEHFLLKTNIFRQLFSRHRYHSLCRALHFVNNATRTPDSHPIFPIEPIINHLNSRFQSAYIPKQEICIDESLTLWKGKLSFKQYIKNKAARLGIKTLELCESATGYMWSFFVYTGKENTPDPRFPSSLNMSTKSVLKLIWPLLDKGYTLFMDNWFNCPLLARFLKKRRTDCVGTLRPNRQNVPSLVSLCKLQAGQFLACHSGDVVIMAYQDKKRVPLISTYHGTEQGLAPFKPHMPPQWKPQLVLDYNKNMGGIDRKDQMLEPYLLERKRCVKWNMKLFKRLLNVTILNSRIHFEKSCNERQLHLSFRLQLVQDIIDKHLDQVPRYHREINPCSRHIRDTSVSRADRDSGLPSRRLTDSVHWPVRFSASHAAGHRTLRRKCIWCLKRNHVSKLTTFVCEYCEVALCLEPCFKLYHTIH